MIRRNIDRWTITFWILQVAWTWSNLVLYYKKIGIFNKHNIPKNAPIIIAPNHQNALMDALSFATQAPTQRIFLTRADIFYSPFAQWVLHIVKMLPIFRIRDGRASLQKNEEVFEIAVEIIHRKKSPLAMFPEGNHGNKRRLRPLVKGIFRIAFMAQEKFKDKPGVKILPTGIDYEHYQKYGKNLLVNYGKPIEVCEYWKEFEENPAAATNSLRNRLSDEMRKVMIDIQTDDYYETYMELREIYRPSLLKKLDLNAKNMLHRFNADKILISSLDKILKNTPEKIELIHQKTQEYIQLRNKQSYREWIYRKSRYSYFGSFINILLSIILIPVLLFGLLNNWANFFIPIQFVKKIKDTQFRSSAAFLMGEVIQFIYYPILITLGFMYLPNIWLKIIYIPLIPISGKAAYSVWRFFIKNWSKLRYNINRNRNQNLSSSIKLRAELIEELNIILK